MALSYILKVTGDCQNNGSGAVYLEPTGGVPPYIVNWLLPVYPVETNITSTTKSNLTAGVFNVKITDSTINFNEELNVSFRIGTDFCTTIEHQNTTCGENNGSISISAFTVTNELTFTLYDLDNNFVSSAQTTDGTYSFGLLEPGGYYIDALDVGGCTARTQTCVIKTSTTFDFTLFVVDTADCFGPSGRVYVVDPTNPGPYTYFWEGGELTPFITGLTAGTYGVTVTDGAGCSVFKSATVNRVPALGLVSKDFELPGCNDNSGEITFYFSGGCLPIKYILSNGDSQVLYEKEVTFTGLSSDIYNLNVIDACKCEVSTSVDLRSPEEFEVFEIVPVKPTCGKKNGSLTYKLVGGTPPFLLSLYLNNTLIKFINTTSTEITFPNLGPGVYVIDIKTNYGCNYIQETTLTEDEKFTLSVLSGGTTCGQNNGFITLTISSGGKAPYIYQVGSQIFTTTLLSQNFENLSPGVYNYSVVDDDGCVKQGSLSIPSSESVEFSLFDTGCRFGSDGTILVLITSGIPPFQITWSLNVGAQTGIYVTGLTAGVYQVTVEDSAGCKLKQETEIFCGIIRQSFETFTVCTDTFTQIPNTKFGISQIYAQGFQDLTVGQDNCILDSATFELNMNIGSSAYTYSFPSTYYSLQSYPTETELAEAVRFLFSGLSGIGSVVIDEEGNYIYISTDCDRALSAETITLDLAIDYEICCVPTTTTTTCANSCREYRLKSSTGAPGDILYVDCSGNTSSVTQVTYLEFCADKDFNFYYDAYLIVEEVGCCLCTNHLQFMKYSPRCNQCICEDHVDITIYTAINNISEAYPNGTMFYKDLCLTEPADSGYYRDLRWSIVYYYDRTSGIYERRVC